MFFQNGRIDTILTNILNGESVKLEHNYICDGCNTQISGTRYNCTQCENFDFCNQCYIEKLKTHDHIFQEISALDALKNALNNNEKIDAFFMPGKTSDPIEKIIHSAFCDRCDEKIIGIRWKCFDCNDFDFCNSCYLVANGIENFKNHKKDHQFGKIENPNNTQSFQNEKENHFQTLQLEKERPEKERLEKERLEKERLEKERLEKERLEKERLEKEPINPFLQKLELLHSMGFNDRNKNIQILIKNKGNLESSINELIKF